MLGNAWFANSPSPTLTSVPFLTSASVDPARAGDGYPFSLAAVRGLADIEFAPVTVLVGDNGTGKSTLVEALAVAAGLNAEGVLDDLVLAEDSASDFGLDAAREFLEARRDGAEVETRTHVLVIVAVGLGTGHRPPSAI